MSLDLSTDYLVFDDPITVSYSVKTAENVWAEGVSVPYCQRSEITKEDLKTDPALLQKSTAVFDLWRLNLSGMIPKIGDKITYLTSTWVVRSVGLMDRDAAGVQRHHCVCIRGTAVTRGDDAFIPGRLLLTGIF